jgi:hypothetical protein
MNFVKIQPPFDVRVNFWDKNYQIAFIKPFNELYENDKSKNKEFSSKQMWGLWLHQDPSSENKIGKLPKQQKLESIKLYCPEFDEEDEIIKRCLESYNQHCLSPAAKAFKEEEMSLAKRSKFITETDYTFDSIELNAKGEPIYIAGKPMVKKGTATELDRMRANTLKIYQQYQEVQKMFQEEEGNVRIWGGGTEGMLDEGSLIDLEDE